jgi:hypothetical protein
MKREKNPLIKQFGGRKWSKNNYYIPYKQRVKGLVDIFAAKNVHMWKKAL